MSTIIEVMSAGSSDSACAHEVSQRDLLTAVKWAGPRRLRRFADACRWAGRHGRDFPEELGAAVRHALASEKHRLRASDIFEDAYAKGTRQRARLAADRYISRHHDCGPEAVHYTVEHLVETVGWSVFFMPPEEIERVAVEAIEAAGLSVPEETRRRIPRWAELVFDSPLSEPLNVPADGGAWPDPVNVNPFAPPPVDPAFETGLKAEWAALLTKWEAEDGVLLGTSPEARVEPSLAPRLDPFAFDNLPGLLGHIARWSHYFAFKPVPEFAVASAIVAISVLFGRRYVGPTGLALNVYIVGIAPTGGGKEAALAAPQALLDEAGFGRLLGPGDFSSNSAIEVVLRRAPCQLFTLDEFGQLLGAFQGRNAPTHAKLARKVLLEVYTKSGPGGRWTGKARASDEIDKASAPIYSPTLTLLACSTIEGFYSGLTEENLGDGLVNRLTVVRASGIGPRNMDAGRTVIPDDLVAQVQAAYAASKVEGSGNMATLSEKPVLRVVPWAGAEAEAEWLAVADWEDAERERSPGRDGILGRAAEQTLKFATIAALARSPGTPAVSVDDVRWGFALVKASINTLDEGVRLNMAGSEFEALVKAIERAIIPAGRVGVTKSELLKRRGISKADDRMVDAALRRLVDLGVIWPIEIATGPNGGRPGVRIRAKMPGEG